ncbi:MAG: lipid-binding SYLF domain-containing protein [Thermodesulfobacteriota bacterium]
MKNRFRRLSGFLSAAILMVTFSGFAGEALPADAADQQILVEKARVTFLEFMADQNMSWLRDHLKTAKGVIIIPELMKAGFFLGGSGGSGVLLVRDEEKNDWSQPAFYTLGSASLGVQFGGEIAEVIMLVQTQQGLQSLYSSSFKLGGDASMTAGPVGVGQKADILTDFVSFTKPKGAYVGVSLEGGVMATRGEWNRAYYGRDVRPVEIVMMRSVSNPGADALREVVQKAALGDGAPKAPR